MNTEEETLLSILDKIRSDAEDIVAVISFGIKPMLNHEDDEEYEISAEKLDKLLKELLSIKDNFNKDFTSLRRKI